MFDTNMYPSKVKDQYSNDYNNNYQSIVILMMIYLQICGYIY